MPRTAYRAVKNNVVRGNGEPFHHLVYQDWDMHSALPTSARCSRCLDVDEDPLAVEYPHQSEPEQHIRQSIQERGILRTKPPSGPRRIAADIYPGPQWHTRTIRLGQTPPGHEPIQHNG